MSGGFWQSLASTAAEVYEPHDVMGLVGLLVISLPALAGAVLAGLALYRQRGTDRKVDDVAAGVQETNRSVNCRPTPMRGDLDEMRAEMRSGFRQLSRDVGGLREELRTERLERIKGDERG